MFRRLPTRIARLARWPLLVAWLGACATEPGHAWGELELSATVQLQVPPDRLVPGGWVRTAAGYGLRLERVEVEVREVAVLVRATGTGSTLFDPANPPDGYSLCHNGHCHRDDGALVAYADVEADLLAASGQSAAPDGAVLLLAENVTATATGATVPLPACSAQDRCALPQGTLALARVRLASVHMVGLIRDLDANRLDGLEVPLQLTFPLATPDTPYSVGAALGSSEELELANGQPAGVRTSLTLSLQPVWLDVIDVAKRIGSDGVLTEADLQDATADVLERFRAATSLQAHVDRFEP